jgi:hypothetical protein
MCYNIFFNYELTNYNGKNLFYGDWENVYALSEPRFLQDF